MRRVRLTIVSNPVGQRRLMLAVDQIESVESRPTGSVVRTKSGVSHFVDERLDEVDRLITEAG